MAHVLDDVSSQRGSRGALWSWGLARGERLEWPHSCVSRGCPELLSQQGSARPSSCSSLLFLPLWPSSRGEGGRWTLLQGFCWSQTWSCHVQQFLFGAVQGKTWTSLPWLKQAVPGSEHCVLIISQPSSAPRSCSWCGTWELFWSSGCKHAQRQGLSWEASRAVALAARPQINSPPCQEHLALDTAETVTSHCHVRFQSLFAQVLVPLSSAEEPQASVCWAGIGPGSLVPLGLIWAVAAWPSAQGCSQQEPAARAVRMGRLCPGDEWRVDPLTVRFPRKTWCNYNPAYLVVWEFPNHIPLVFPGMSKHLHEC